MQQLPDAKVIKTCGQHIHQAFALICGSVARIHHIIIILPIKETLPLHPPTQLSPAQAEAYQKSIKTAQKWNMQ